MHSVTAVRARGRAFDPQDVSPIYQLRHAVFRERLGWEVSSEHGLERDEYDDLDPVYLVVSRAAGSVEGCLRLLPTTGPYMLRDTFPQLLAGEAAPVSPSVWDVSRFATAPSDPAGMERRSVRRVTADLILGGIDHALDHGIEHYVAVVSVALERIFRRIGLPVRRFGDGQARMVGKTLSVAIWMEMSQPIRDRVAARQRTTL